eukprot:1020373-Amphidinium_carterae.1
MPPRFCPERIKDASATHQKLLQAYVRAEIERKTAKATKDQDQATLWGAHLDGRFRRVHASVEKRRLLVLATLETCCMHRVPPRLVQVLCGLWQHYLAFFRPGMCILDITYGWLQSCHHDGQLCHAKKALTRKVRDDLLMLCVLAPIMCCQLD